MFSINVEEGVRVYVIVLYKCIWVKIIEIVFLFFFKNKIKIYVYLKMDNIIVVLYVNKIWEGGMRFLILIKINNGDFVLEGRLFLF